MSGYSLATAKSAPATFGSKKERGPRTGGLLTPEDKTAAAGAPIAEDAPVRALEADLRCATTRSLGHETRARGRKDGRTDAGAKEDPVDASPTRLAQDVAPEDSPRVAGLPVPAAAVPREHAGGDGVPVGDGLVEVVRAGREDGKGDLLRAAAADEAERWGRSHLGGVVGVEGGRVRPVGVRFQDAVDGAEGDLDVPSQRA